MSKPKSLADRIAETKNQNVSTDELKKEKTLFKALTKQSNRATEQLPRQQSNRASEQVSNRTTEQARGHLFEQLPRQQSNRATEQLPRQQSNRASEQVSNRTTEQVESFDMNLKPKDLKSNQYQILFEIYFNRPFKVSGPERIGLCWKPPIAYGTVRNTLSSLEKKGYISKPTTINDGVRKGSTCQVSELKCKPLFGGTPVINSEQVSNRASEQVSNRTSEQATTSYKIDRQIYNNLSIYLKNSDYWNKQGLTLKKITGWCEQHKICTPEFVLHQLQFGEQHPKVKEAKSPVSYFFKSIMSGGLERPSGFEFPEERATRLKKEKIAKQQETIETLEKARQKERELADQEAFLTFLLDHDAVKATLDEIKKEHITPTLNASINMYLKTQHINTRLENRLKIYFQKN